MMHQVAGRGLISTACPFRLRGFLVDDAPQPQAVDINTQAIPVNAPSGGHFCSIPNRYFWCSCCFLPEASGHPVISL
jgi:hypothetical protein